MAEPRVTTALEAIVSPTRLLSSAVDCLAYGYDNSKQSSTPDYVAFPETHEEVVALVNLCKDFQLPIVARGRGTGTVGGAIPTQGGLVLSFERMAQILDFTPKNQTITVQPGVTNGQVQTLAKSHGYFWAPDPSSAAYCTVGGNLAYNSAGPRALKYGTTRENTLGLRAVTGNGDTLKTGTKTTKGVVGYDLTRLLIGSEGTLAITTEAILKLLPLAPHRRTLQAYYQSLESATCAVVALMNQPIVPYALEFIDRPSLDAILKYKPLEIPEDTEAVLMIELDGYDFFLDYAVKEIIAAAEQPGIISIQAATTTAEIDHLWSLRKALSPALRQIAPKKINEDVVVPVNRLPELIRGIHEFAAHYQIKNANFGHAGNGNIHVNLLINPDDPDEMARAKQCLDDLFTLVLRLEGTLSGEHGVGLMKQAFIARECDPTSLQLMRQIKTQFDPMMILNPGKIWLPS